jgi:hypothetical protein
MSSFTLYLPYANLYHTLLDYHIYLMGQVTCGRWCILNLLRSSCSTSLSPPLDMGNPRVGMHLHPHHRVCQSTSSSCWPCKTSSWGCSWRTTQDVGQPPTTSLPAGHGFILLRLLGNSPATPLRADDPTRHPSMSHCLPLWSKCHDSMAIFSKTG